MWGGTIRTQTDKSGGESQLPGAAALELALAQPERRPAALRRVLAAINRELPAAGTALFWPSFDDASHWRAEYAGEEREKVERWTRSRLRSPLEEIAADLSAGAPRPSGAKPVALDAGFEDGLWVLWGGLSVRPERLEPFRRALELFVEVERLEQKHFRSPRAPLGEEATQALRRGDGEVMTDLLSLARDASGADFAYWGSVHDGVVDVEWQLGAGDSGFGFELPIGEGVGGRVFARDRVLEIPDYLNCRYRYPEVSDITDSERVRSVLAVPIHGEGAKTGAVLYTVRREVSGFSAAQRTLLQRLSRSVEPVRGPRPASRRSAAPQKDSLRQAKSGLRRILVGSDKVQEIQSWLERTTGGQAVLTDHRDLPYLPRDADRLERLRESGSGPEPRVVPLQGNGGSLYLSPGRELDPWPDFVEDAAAACEVVAGRAEQDYRRLNQRRPRWVREVMDGREQAQLLREGNRLGLPVESGEVWAIAHSASHGSGDMRAEMLAEEIGLDKLGSPLISLDGGIGVFLLKGEPRTKPEAVRDELLRAFEPGPLWLVHGAAYESLTGLGEALAQATGVAERARREGGERYVAEVNRRGLDSLLEHPRLSAEISDFGESLLEPLISYDHERGSRLTETFCLSLTLDSTSEVSRRLFVHENTVRYRLRRAQQILDCDLTSSKDHVAFGLAAFAWLRRGT